MKNVMLIDIGAGPLPVVTPVPARQSAWFPVLHTAPPLPTPPNVHTTAVADGILVEWDAVPIDGVIYVVSRAPAEAGPYVIVHRTTGLRYLHTDNTGEPSWFRVSIELNGRESVPSVPVVETPVDVTDAIAGADQAAADALAAALAADAKAAQEIIDRQTADAVLAAEQAVLRAQVGDILEADTWVNDRTYPKGDLVQFGGKLYRAKIAVPVNKPVTNTAYWELLGDYASLGEAVSATAANVVVNTAAIAQIDGVQTALSETVSQHAARMPTGTGKLATDARLTSVESAAASATGAVGNRVGLIEVRMPTGTDTLANEARVVTAENASVSRDNALSGRVGTVEARMPSGTGRLATQASVTQVDQASVTRDEANAAAITQVRASQSDNDNLVGKSRFDDGLLGPWPAVSAQPWGGAAQPTFTHFARINASSYLPASIEFMIPVKEGDVIDMSADLTAYGMSVGGVYQRLEVRDSALGVIGYLNGDRKDAGTPGSWENKAKTVVVPAGGAWIRPGVTYSAGLGGTEYGGFTNYRVYRRSKVENESASITQSLTANVGPGGAWAQATMTIDVNGRISGYRHTNTGTESAADFAADRFSVTSATGAGLQWTNGTLWNRRGNYSFLTGPTLGDGMVFYIGATPASPGAATKAKAGLSFDTTGNLEVRGKVKSSILESSALQAGSTRIHTINGRLAPFTIVAGGMVSSTNDQGHSMIIGPFHSPDATLTDQFHPRRLAFFKQDLIIDASAVGFSTEKLEILCQYNGAGGWIPIVDYTTDRGTQGIVRLLIRYTTRSTNWHTLHFMIRTGINRSKTLTVQINASNFNESGNASESNSGINAGDVAGSNPPANGGGGSPYNPGDQIVNP